MKTEFKFIYVTASSEFEVQGIARELVSRRLVACANILPGMQSVYQWKGKVEEAQEWVLIMKTRADLEKDCIQAVTDLHSYECPCVVSLDITGGHPAFLQWLGAEVKG